MVSTSGSQLLPTDAVDDLRTKLLPLTTVLTPNIPEARLLLETSGETTTEPHSVDDMIRVAKQLQTLGPKNVLLKGGHLPLSEAVVRPQAEATDGGKDESKRVVVDVLCREMGEVVLFETEFLTSKNTHGTGCSLASAIAANLALGKDLEDAVRSAVRYVEAGIKTSVDLGKGSGPINHFHSMYSLPFAPYVFHPHD